MIKQITFASGRSASAAPLSLDPRPITVLVGPNNSGKSLALKEIEGWCKAGPQQQRKVIADIDVDLPDVEQALAELEPFKRRPGAGQVVQEGYINVRRPDPNQDGTYDQQIHEPSFRSQWPRDWTYVSQSYLSFFTVRLDGRTRFSLTQPRSSGDLQELPQNHLAALFKDDEAREKIRKVVEDAFGLHFVIDPTNIGQFRIRMSRRAPSDSQEEQALDERARSFHEAATDILELSDGVQAFTGILAAVLSANYKIVLIDEPEAFLAPALRRKLGSRLATLAQEREGALVAATHDAHFLMGCVQSGAYINVVRMTYREGDATARLLKPETLLGFMRDPLLRSTNVLDALFHESAVVTEADTDRAFYQEVNERLLGSEREGIDNCLFLNARNKQTVPQVAGPLREIGIPAAMVVDIDVLKDGGRVWSKLLDAAYVPETSRTALNSHRVAVKRAFDESGKDMKKDGGVAVLDRDARESCMSLLDHLADYGIFVVPVGELESWLAELDVVGHGPDWLIEVFEKMGTNPRSAGYVTPKDNDVWEFLEKIGKWIRDASRKGMPE
jgi:ABC-type cobalamin/Fe3+-siderophores transport system ATPase subunit